MFVQCSPSKVNRLVESLIEARCAQLKPSDILVEGAFSRPENALWSPAHIQFQTLYLSEGPIGAQLLAGHKHENEKFLAYLKENCSSSSESPFQTYKAGDFETPILNMPAQQKGLELKLPREIAKKYVWAERCALTVNPGYPPKIFAGLNRLKCKRRPTVSGFCQARIKLSSTVSEEICKAFTDQILNNETLKDLDTLYFAIDGSNVPITVNFDEPENVKCTAGKPRAALHLNAACCLNAGNVLAAALIQTGKKDEHDGAWKLIHELKEKFPDKRLIFIMDRLCFSYKLVSYCQQNNIDLIIRLKSWTWQKLSGGLPLKQESDKEFCQVCTSKLDKTIKEHPEDYCHISKVKLKEIIDELKIPEGEDLNLRFRLAAVEMPEDIRKVLAESETVNKDDEAGYTYIYTTISIEEMSVEELVSSYFTRWQIEVAYGLLKYKTGMNALHSEKQNNILQEIWLSILKYNMTCVILCHAQEKLLKKKRRSKKKGMRKPKEDPRKPASKTCTVLQAGDEPVYEAKISFSETARNLRKFILGCVTEEEFLDELDLQIVYTIKNRHTPRGTTQTRLHGFQWSFS